MVVEWEDVIDDEMILWEGRPHVGLAVGLGVLGMLIAISGAIIMQTALADGSVLMALVLGAPPFVIGVLVGLAGGSRRLRTRYAVTNHAVYVFYPWPFSGLTRKELQTGNATVRRDLTGRVLGSGDIVIDFEDDQLVLVGSGDAEAGLKAVRQGLNTVSSTEQQ